MRSEQPEAPGCDRRGDHQDRQERCYVDITTPEGKATHLLHTSAVKCEHLITIDQVLIRRTIGILSSAMMREIDACLKASLELT